jgi:hypothetical protein
MMTAPRPRRSTIGTKWWAKQSFWMKMTEKCLPAPAIES